MKRLETHVCVPPSCCDATSPLLLNFLCSSGNCSQMLIFGFFDNSEINWTSAVVLTQIYKSFLEWVNSFVKCVLEETSELMHHLCSSSHLNLKVTHTNKVSHKVFWLWHLTRPTFFCPSVEGSVMQWMRHCKFSLCLGDLFLVYSVCKVK